MISRRKPSGAILPPVTQRPARLGVAVHEATLFVVHEQGVGGPLEELLEPSLALLDRFLEPLALGDVARDRAQRPLAVVGDHGRAGVNQYHRAVLAAVPALSYVAPLLLEAAPHVTVDVLLVVVDEVVDLPAEELLFGVTHHPSEGFVGLEDPLGLNVVEVDCLDALLHHRPVSLLALLESFFYALSFNYVRLPLP